MTYGCDIAPVEPGQQPAALPRACARARRGIGLAHPGGRRAELARGLCRTAGQPIPVVERRPRTGAVAVRHAAQFPGDRRHCGSTRPRRAEGYVIRSVDDRRASGDRHRRERRMSACCTARSISCGCMQTRAAARCARHRRPQPRVRSIRVLNHWDNLDGTSSAATPGSRSGTGTSCRTISIRATPTTRAPARRSASTAPCSRT